MNRLKELRKQNGLTQEEVADRIGAAVITYRKWERMESDFNKANVDSVYKIAQLFEVSIEYLMGWGDNTNE